MRKFQISSINFQGHFEIIFDDDGLLQVLNLRPATGLNRALIHSIKKKVPEHLSDLEAAFKDTYATVVEADFCISFEDFWNAYDKKINRKRCLPLWEKLSNSKQVKAFYGIRQYDKFLKQESWRKKADPENYLRAEMWENEWS